MTDIKPMRDLIVVEVVEKEELSAGGIILPGAINETNTLSGKVVTIGDGALNEKTGEVTEIDVQVGDTVLFHEKSGIKVSEDRQTPVRLLIREEDVLAIVVED